MTMLKIGFIDLYLDNWHAHKYPAWFRSNQAGIPADVTIAYGQADRPGGLSSQDWCERYGVQSVHSIEAVIAASDALVVLAPDHPETHLELAREALQSGKPTYVDKTFAPDGNAARQLIQWAHDSQTPFFSSSALRYAAELEPLDFAGKAEYVRTHGSGNWQNYTVHQLEMVSTLMGRGIQRIRASLPMGVLELDLDFGDGRHASITVGSGLPFGFYAVPPAGSAVWVPAVNSQLFFERLIATMVRFFVDRQPPVHAADTLDIMRVIGTLPVALENHGQWTDLN